MIYKVIDREPGEWGCGIYHWCFQWCSALRWPQFEHLCTPNPRSKERNPRGCRWNIFLVPVKQNYSTWSLHISTLVTKTTTKKISTSADKLENITGIIYRASVTLVKWDVCSEPKDTKRQHPPSHSLFTLLLSDNRYRSVCCCTTRPQNSFIPQAERLLNSSSILHSVEYFLSFLWCRIKGLNTRLKW